MKYYKITLRQNAGSTQLIYPNRYQEEIGNFNKEGFYYSDLDQPMLLVSLNDKDANNIIREGVVEISESEARGISEQYQTRTEKITDEVKIRRIELKAKLGLSLTEDEIKAINPNDPTPGFSKEQILADKIDQLKEMENLKKVK